MKSSPAKWASKYVHRPLYISRGHGVSLLSIFMPPGNYGAREFVIKLDQRSSRRTAFGSDIISIIIFSGESSQLPKVLRSTFLRCSEKIFSLFLYTSCSRLSPSPRTSISSTEASTGK
uniref:Uncharacterized protein n=1 Tax=Arundo donax TaxID=35708 RepID=A0A0A9E573_ARUDO